MEKYKLRCFECQSKESLSCFNLVTCGCYGDPIDYDCAFPWDDMHIDSPNCEDCPLILCKECRDTLIVKFWNMKHPGVDELMRKVETHSFEYWDNDNINIDVVQVSELRKILTECLEGK